MANGIFLDDRRWPREAFPQESDPRYLVRWWKARSYIDFTMILDNIDWQDDDEDRIQYISFDYDLGTDKKTGMDAARFLFDWWITNDKPRDAFPIISVHSTHYTCKRELQEFIDASMLEHGLTSIEILP